MLSKQNTGLIVIDIQGKLADIVHDSKALMDQTAKLIQGAKLLRLPILWLEQTPDKIGSTQAQIANLLASQEPIKKHTFSGAGSAEFIVAVKQTPVKTWLICGIETHICVYQTAMQLLDLGYKVEVVVDCVSSRTLFNKELAISKLLANGATTSSVEMCLYELVADSNAPEFKDILKLIK
ncbi:isochorismatase family protein [Marinomonas sp. TW1]|uniref:isochorismatase family protein n=1 Tax=Marinomonas sp. TW1 TaxID=1561203 RepID=UPI0007AFBB6A|nr:isochorismatase family protein [Marinomonas sp. TW1]KZN13045.1 isochorismatase [Marinomonas sp. TW1]